MDSDEYAQIVRRYREHAPMVIDAIILQAPLLRAKFNALVKEGFTEAQALELCRGPLLQ